MRLEGYTDSCGKLSKETPRSDFVQLPWIIDDPLQADWVADTEHQHASGAASVSSSEQTRGNMLTAVYAACPVKSEPLDLHKLSLVLHCVEVRGRHR